MKIRDTYRSGKDTKPCVKCQKPIPEKWKGKLCKECFGEWKEKMVADGKWDESRVVTR